MKKIAFLTVFTLFLTQLTFAQFTAANDDSEGKGFRFGLQASPTWSWMKTDDKLIERQGTNWGLKFGVLGEKYFTSQYALFSGIGFGLNQGGFLQNGYAKGSFWTKSDLSDPVKFDTLPENAKLHYRLTYVEIPIGFKMRGGSNTDSRIQYYVEAPVFNIGILTKAIGDISGTNTQNTEDEVIRDDVNGLSLSWGFGAGIEYEISSSSRFAVGLAYQKQFTDATDNSGYVVNTAGVGKADKSKGTIGMLSLRAAIFF